MWGESVLQEKFHIRECTKGYELACGNRNLYIYRIRFVVVYIILWNATEDSIIAMSMTEGVFNSNIDNKPY